MCLWHPAIDQEGPNLFGILHSLASTWCFLPQTSRLVEVDVRIEGPPHHIAKRRAPFLKSASSTQAQRMPPVAVSSAPASGWLETLQRRLVFSSDVACIVWVCDSEFSHLLSFFIFHAIISELCWIGSACGFKASSPCSVVGAWIKGWGVARPLEHALVLHPCLRFGPVFLDRAFPGSRIHYRASRDRASLIHPRICIWTGHSDLAPWLYALGFHPEPCALRHSSVSICGVTISVSHFVWCSIWLVICDWCLNLNLKSLELEA